MSLAAVVSKMRSKLGIDDERKEVPKKLTPTKHRHDVKHRHDESTSEVSSKGDKDAEVTRLMRSLVKRLRTA